MPAKFQVGDRVRVTANQPCFSSFNKGDSFTITKAVVDPYYSDSSRIKYYGIVPHLADQGAVSEQYVTDAYLERAELSPDAKVLAEKIVEEARKAAKANGWCEEVERVLAKVVPAEFLKTTKKVTVSIEIEVDEKATRSEVRLAAAEAMKNGFTDTSDGQRYTVIGK